MKTLSLLLLILCLGCSKQNEIISIIPRTTASITFDPLYPCVDSYFNVIFNNGYGNSCGKSKIQLWQNSDWFTVSEGVPVDGVITYSMQALEGGNYKFRGLWTKQGKDCKYDNVKVQDSIRTNYKCCTTRCEMESVCGEKVPFPCVYGVYCRFRSAADTWITITGHFDNKSEICYIRDDHNINWTVSEGEITATLDIPECENLGFYIFFKTQESNQGSSWNIHDMNGLINYDFQFEGCPQ